MVSVMLSLSKHVEGRLLAQLQFFMLSTVVIPICYFFFFLWRERNNHTQGLVILPIEYLRNILLSIKFLLFELLVRKKRSVCRQAGFSLPTTQIAKVSLYWNCVSVPASKKLSLIKPIISDCFSLPSIIHSIQQSFGRLRNDEDPERGKNP